MPVSTTVNRKPKAFPWVVTEYCEGCSHCTTVCPHGALKMCQAEKNDLQIPWILDIPLCNGCGTCQNACVWGGIQLTAHVDEAITRMEGRKEIMFVLPSA